MKKFWLNCFLATLFVFGLMWALDKLMNLNMFDAFDPIGQALSDFELTDYAFSNIRPDPDVDERILIVNIGNLSRAGIAEQLRIISKHQPRVIGIDGFFNCDGGLRDTVNCPQLLDVMGNLLLSNAIQEAGNVVLVSKLHQSFASFKAGEVDVYDSMEYSDAMFQDYAASGFANLPTANKAEYQEDVKISRVFVPKLEVNERQEVAFSVKVAMLYDSVKAAILLQRDKDEELVNFMRNIEVQELKSRVLKSKDLSTTKFGNLYSALDVDQVLNEEFQPELVRDKIVLFGFLGSYLGDPAWNDKFFTPLNKKVAGRANPDMFGVVIHANIISMILDGTYIEELEEWHQYLIAFVFCFFNIALFFYINDKYPVWFDSVSLVIQLVQIVLLMLLTVMVFGHWGFKLDLTIAIVTIALAGPVFEFYDNVLTTSVRNLKNKRLTKRKEQVLTTHDQDIL